MGGGARREVVGHHFFNPQKGVGRIIFDYKWGVGHPILLIVLTKVKLDF